MARKIKTDPNAPGADAEKRKNPAPGIGDNSKGKALSDDERRMLAFQHKDRYSVALAAKKAADAKFKNVCKLAKAELGPGAIDSIKDLIALEDPEGEDELRARLQRQAEALRWAGVPVGTQIEFALQRSEGDTQTSEERAFDEGKMASMANQPAKPKYAPASVEYEAFMTGYAEHQGTLAARLGRGNGEGTEAG